jgi:hypothetical protein
MASSENVKDLFKQQTLKEPKLVQLDKVLFKWFTAMCSKGNPMTRPMIIDKAISVYDEMKIHGKCAFSVGINRKSPVRTKFRLIIKYPLGLVGARLKEFCCIFIYSSAGLVPVEAYKSLSFLNVVCVCVTVMFCFSVYFQSRVLQRKQLKHC